MYARSPTCISIIPSRMKHNWKHWFWNYLIQIWRVLWGGMYTMNHLFITILIRMMDWLLLDRKLCIRWIGVSIISSCMKHNWKNWFWNHLIHIQQDLWVGTYTMNHLFIRTNGIYWIFSFYFWFLLYHCYK